MQINTGSRKTASRAQIAEAIRSGQYTMVVGGVEVTDFKKIEAALGSWPKAEPKSKGKSQVERLVEKFNNRCYHCKKECDKDSAIKRPVRDWLMESESHRNAFSNLVLSCFECFARRHRQPPITVKINGTEFRPKRLEHFGDAVILLAARLMSHEAYGYQQSIYCAFATTLVSNQNLATYPGIRHPDQFEIIIGQELMNEGFEPALDKAKEMLRATKAFRELEEGE